MAEGLFGVATKTTFAFDASRSEIGRCHPAAPAAAPSAAAAPLRFLLLPLPLPLLAVAAPMSLSGASSQCLWTMPTPWIVASVSYSEYVGHAHATVSPWLRGRCA